MGDSDPIRVLLVDDHAVVRSGLAAFLLAYDDLELVGEAGGGEEAVRLCERPEQRPDVVLMDLMMPGMDGAATTRAIKERWPELRVLALTSFKEKDLVQTALEAGATGYLLKSVSADELVQAIRAAHAGRRTLSPEAAQTLDLFEKLERLARAIIAAPPDASALPHLLAEHVPKLLPHCQVEIRLFPDRVLVRHPAGAPQPPAGVWQWAGTPQKVRCFPPGAALPWEGRLPAGTAAIAGSITDAEQREAIGALYVLQPQDAGASTAVDLLPAVEALAEQVGSAVRAADRYAQSLAQQRIAHELALAWQVQASFLPRTLPPVDGWQLAAALEPARETSGDFYDTIPLPGGRLGLVVADVADKGMGAALYMALSRTLLRTFAAQYPEHPERVLEAVNRRILADTDADLFVSVFYGVLDPGSGTLDYCNAGHNPPYLFRSPAGSAPLVLERTGTLVGVFEDQTWGRAQVQLAPGDVLLLYTDGLTEAQDTQGAFFDTQRVLQAVQANLGRPAGTLRDALLAAVRAFSGGAPQADDLTLLLLMRSDEEAARPL